MAFAGQFCALFWGDGEQPGASASLRRDSHQVYDRMIFLSRSVETHGLHPTSTRRRKKKATGDVKCLIHFTAPWRDDSERLAMRVTFISTNWIFPSAACSYLGYRGTTLIFRL